VTPATVVVVVPIGADRGEQVDIRVSITKVMMTIAVIALRTAGRRNSGSSWSPQPESYGSSS